MVKSKILLMLLLMGCKSAGDIRVYNLDPSLDQLTREDEAIALTDPKLQCEESEEARECPYVCVSAEDMAIIADVIRRCNPEAFAGAKATLPPEVFAALSRTVNVMPRGPNQGLQCSGGVAGLLDN